MSTKTLQKAREVDKSQRCRGKRCAAREGRRSSLFKGQERRGDAMPPPHLGDHNSIPAVCLLGTVFSRRCPLTYHRPPQWGIPGRWPGQSTSGQRRRRSRQVGRTTTLFGNWRYPTGERLLPHPSCPASHADATQGMRAYVPQSDLHANRLWRFGFERTSAALSHMKHGSESTRAEPPRRRCTRMIGRAG